MADIRDIREMERELQLLYNPDCSFLNFDNDFYQTICSTLDNLENQNIHDDRMNTVLNSDIKLYEVERQTRNSKSKKSTGIAKIPNEVLNNSNVVHVIYKFLNFCFAN